MKGFVRGSLALAGIALGASLCLSPILAGCGNDNASAQAALDSAGMHLANDNRFYNEAMEQTGAWREAYLASITPPSMGEGMAETLTFLEAAEQAIAGRRAELEGAITDLETVAEMDVDPVYVEAVRLVTEVVDGELAYCDGHLAYLARAKVLSTGEFPPDDSILEEIERMRLELADLRGDIDEKYEAAAAYLLQLGR